MSIAQHAGNILEAWKVKNLSDFNAALDKAWIACATSFPTSPLEAEREEMLQSVVEDLQKRKDPAQLPGYSRCAAITLLRHLSSSYIRQDKSESLGEKLIQKLKVRPQTYEMVFRRSNAAHEAEQTIGRIRTLYDISSN